LPFTPDQFLCVGQESNDVGAVGANNVEPSLSLLSADALAHG
jgi:hypothetical protein